MLDVLSGNRWVTAVGPIRWSVWMQAVGEIRFIAARMFARAGLALAFGVVPDGQLDSFLPHLMTMMMAMLNLRWKAQPHLLGWQSFFKKSRALRVSMTAVPRSA